MRRLVVATLAYAEVVVFPCPQAYLSFPLAAKVLAAAHAEERASDVAASLAFLDRDTVVLSTSANTRTSSMRSSFWLRLT